MCLPCYDELLMTGAIHLPSSCQPLVYCLLHKRCSVSYFQIKWFLHLFMQDWLATQPESPLHNMKPLILKSIKNFEIPVAEHYNKPKSLLSMGPCASPIGHLPTAFWHSFSLWTTGFYFSWVGSNLGKNSISWFKKI